MSDGIRLEARRGPRRLVVLAHGVGATAVNMEPLGRQLNDAVEGLAVYLPEAPDQFDRLPQGRRWFSIAGVTEANRPDRVSAALLAFRTRILAEADRLKLKPTDVFIGGFSQGAIMALSLGVEGPEKWAGVISLSGRLAERPSEVKTGLSALIRHGDADPVMPVAQARLAAEWLNGGGWSVDLQIVAGLGHSLDRSAPDKIVRFISDEHRPPLRG